MFLQKNYQVIELILNKHQQNRHRVEKKAAYTMFSKESHLASTQLRERKISNSCTLVTSASIFYDVFAPDA